MRPASACIVSFFACGCGLVLDVGPDDPAKDAGGRVDSAAGATDSGARDATSADAPRADAPGFDAGPLLPPPCGGPSALFDDFEDGAPSPYWSPPEPGTTLETGGAVHFDPASATGIPRFAAYRSSFDYDAREDRIAAHVLGVIPTAGVQTLLSLDNVGLNSAGIWHDDGFLFAWLDGVVDGERYDPVEHAWWQIRSDGTNVHFEVSRDGVAWSRIGSGATAPTPPWFAAVSATIGTLVLDPRVMPSGFAVMDDFNLDPPRPAGGPLHARYCDAHTFADEFADGTLDPDRWYMAACAISEGMGVLKVGATTDAMRPCGVVTRHAYDLRSSQAVFERATTFDAASWVISVADAAGNAASAFCASESFIVAVSDGPWMTVSGCPDDPFWRFEVRSGRVVASTSDGSTWSSDVPSPASAMDTTALRIGVFSAAGHAGGTEVASYNPPGL